MPARSRDGNLSDMHKKTKRRGAKPTTGAAASGGDDTQVSAEMLLKALHALEKRVKLDRSYDVPYLAGYSRDGKTIYIDRDLPKSFAAGKKRIEVDPFLLLHETVEKSLADALGLVYQHAHQMALRVEEAAVRAAGVSWRKYDAFMQKYIKVAEEDADLQVPPDLDLEPYEDEHDAPTLRRLRDAAAKERRGPKRAAGASGATKGKGSGKSRRGAAGKEK